VSIIRAPRPKGNFYVLDKRISEDTNLSWGARGMLIFLLGKPDNWRVSIQNLVNETLGSKRKSGRDAVYAFIAELKEAGYITVFQNRSETGVFGETDYLVHEHSEPRTEIPEPDNSPLPDSPEAAKPEAVNPDAETPNTVNPTLISTKNQEISTTTNKESKTLAQSSSKNMLLETLEIEFDQSDHLFVSDIDLVAIKPIVCQWVLTHSERSIQDWIYYYALSAQFEAKRGRPILRPSAFIQAVMQNPVQDWTQVECIKVAKARERNQKTESARMEAESRSLAANEVKIVNESLAIFYELSQDRQQELLANFRGSNPAWSRLDFKSKIFQHMLADWLRGNNEDLGARDLPVKSKASPGELMLKQ
jgi:hypothetical protein